MLVVGLTGGIGSGKSTVARMFENLGIPIYYSDIEAKELMHRSKIIKRRLLARFGKEVYKDNQLNKPFLANLIFSDKEHLKYVNSVVHPKVHQHFKRWVDKQKKLNKPYVIQENAILFENKSYLNFDLIITVTAPKELKINRVILRDKTTKEKVLERMNNQWNDEDKVNKSDYVINNTKLEDVEKQVLQLHKTILLSD